MYVFSDYFYYPNNHYFWVVYLNFSIPLNTLLYYSHTFLVPNSCCVGVVNTLFPFVNPVLWVVYSLLGLIWFVVNFSFPQIYYKLVAFNAQ